MAATTVSGAGKAGWYALRLLIKPAAERAVYDIPCPHIRPGELARPALHLPMQGLKGGGRADLLMAHKAQIPPGHELLS